jgi:hypothetical protein
VVAAVDERHAHALHRRTGEVAVLQRLLDALVDRGTETLRDDATDDLVDELVPDAFLHRLDLDVAVAELAAAAGLLLVPAVGAGLALDRLDVRHARLVQLHLDAEPALRPLDRDLDVHLAHAGQELLPRLRVAREPERRVLLREAAERLRDLVLVALRLRRHGEAHHRLREAERGRLEVVLGVDEHVARLHVLQLGDGADVAGAEPVRLLVLLALERHQRPEALLRVVAVVDERRVRLHLTRVHPEDRDASRERVGDRLEHEGRDRGVGLDRRALLRGARHPLDQQVEQLVAPEVLRRDAARDRVDLVARDGVLQRVRDVGVGNLLPAQVALHQRLVRLDDGVEQLRAVFLDDLLHLVRHRNRVAFAGAARIHVRVVVQQVDDALQLVLRSDRKLDRHAALGQLLLDGCEDAEEVGALAVEHVHEDDAREAELLGAVPHARRVHLDAHHAGDDDDRPFDDAQRRDRVGLEAGVARRVDQVDLAPLPLEVGDGRGQRHLAALLVLVPVTHGRARLDRSQPVGGPGLEEQRLDEGRLPRAPVSDDGDVAYLPGLLRHLQLLLGGV